ncbi:hypothetical protein AWM75_06790 [Aerococcus urinaehominis]|uniref:Riboflavin transporter n=1 Tax=Aerococcus urinaehominis TaxID=128944 RepID=A0A0X8FLU9_9LACT|nr:ECF transporter S component [Aerococcus urinaehominis]AMB99707.1 hypothetical protein AWM75_06790 [Aerococcus urinaehominis]SDL91350.1 Riboflavin transporter FmnP [Aerococcus urinaehominis]
MRKQSTQAIVMAAVMGALAYLLMFFAFPILPALPFLKVDFSDIPLALATFSYGPGAGFLAILVRSVLHYLQTGGDMGYPIGDAASLLASMAYVFSLYYIIKGQNKEGQLGKGGAKHTWLAYLVAVLAMTLVMSVLNYFVITPFYMQVMGLEIPNMQEYILLGIVPFNLIKGIIISIVSHLILSRLLPKLTGRKIK